MSLFHTKIKVDLKPILSAMPKGAVVHGIAWDNEAGELIVLWECERFHSGLTVPINLPPEDLKLRRLPVGVRDLSRKEKPKPPVNGPLKTIIEPVKPNTPIKQNLIHTEKEYQAALKVGKSLEFWGVEPFWKPVEDEHVYTPGFHYREREQNKVVDGAAVAA